MRQSKDLPQTLAGERSFTLGGQGPFPSSPRAPGPGMVQLRLEAVDGRALEVKGPLPCPFLAKVEAIGSGVEALRVGDRVLGESPPPLGSHLTLKANMLRQAPMGDGGLKALSHAITKGNRALEVVGLARVIRGGCTPQEPVILSFRDAWALPLQSRPVDELFDPEGRYLLSGIQGPRGVMILRWAIARGARHIICLGAGEPSGEVKSALNRLKAEGALCRYLALDPGTNPGGQLLRDILGDEPLPLLGVMHQAKPGERETRRLQTLNTLGQRERIFIIDPSILDASQDVSALFETLDRGYLGRGEAQDSHLGLNSKP